MELRYMILLNKAIVILALYLIIILAA